MTIQEAIDAISGAEIRSSTVPVRKLQRAILTIMSAAKRASLYDAKLVEGKLVEIPDCNECAFNGGIAYWHQCEKCLGEASNNFLPIIKIKEEEPCQK